MKRYLDLSEFLIDLFNKKNLDMWDIRIINSHYYNQTAVIKEGIELSIEHK